MSRFTVLTSRALILFIDKGFQSWRVPYVPLHLFTRRWTNLKDIFFTPKGSIVEFESKELKAQTIPRSKEGTTAKLKGSQFHCFESMELADEQRLLKDGDFFKRR